MVQGDRTVRPHGIPEWLQAVPVPSQDVFEAWGAREQRRLEALEMLGYGLLRGDNARVEEAQLALEGLPPAPAVQHDVDPAQDPLSAAMRGWLTTEQLVDYYRAGMVELSDQQHAFIGDVPSRIRLLALARKRDLGVEYLEEQLFPGGQRAVALAARSAPGDTQALAAWLDEHPELTGSTETHWRA